VVELGDHTKLMNIMIGLCYKVPKWPNPFLQKNYVISKIELKIHQSNPDIIITNKKKNHSIIFECKSSDNLKESQMAKYDKIRNNPILLIQSGKVPITHKDQFIVDPVYSSFKDLSKNELISKYNMLCIYVKKGINCKIDSLILTRGVFRNTHVNKIFPIDTSKDEPPYRLYPFDENDKELFTIEILNQLQKFAYKQQSFKIPQLLEGCHSLWKFIDDNKKFERKANGILHDLQRSKLKGYLSQDKVSGEWSVIIKPNVRSFQAFQKKCKQVIKELDFKSYQDTLENQD